MDCFLGENVLWLGKQTRASQKESRVWMNDLGTSFDLKYSWCRTTAVSDKFLQSLCVLKPVHSNTRKDRLFGQLHSNGEYRMPNDGLSSLNSRIIIRCSAKQTWLNCYGKFQDVITLIKKQIGAFNLKGRGISELVGFTWNIKQWRINFKKDKWLKYLEFRRARN